MEILTDYNDLIGKKIVFCHMAQFAEQITLATEDGCILMATMDVGEFEESKEVRVLYPHRVLQILNQHEWLRNELGKLGVFDVAKYEEEQRIEREKRQTELQKRKEEKERQEYERLKTKYGSK